MSDNLPAIPQLRTSQELVNPVTDSWAEMLPQVVELARSICGTDFVPAALRNNIAGTTAAILYNREIGLPPMTGLNAVHVIKGKVGISAEMMRAQVLAAGHEIWFDETNTSFCTMSGRRAGSDRVTTVKYSESDAKTAGLFTNDNYRKNPRRMYQARATSELCALIFADVIRGMVSSEELYAEEEAGDSIAVPAEGGTTVQRKTRGPRRTAPAALEPSREVPLPGESKTDGGAAPAVDAPTTAGSPAASPSPVPPLPGETEYESSAAATAEQDAGVAAAAPSADGESRVPAAPASTPQSDGGAAAPPAAPMATPVGAGGGEQGGATPAAAESATTTAAPPSPPLPGEEDLPEPVEDITDPQRKKLFALMAEHGLRDRDRQIRWMSKNLSRELTSRAQVGKDDAIRLIDLLEQLDETPRPISRGDLRLLGGLFKELGITVVAERLHIASAVVGRTPLKDGQPSSEGLTAAEGKTLMDALARCKTRDHVEALVQLAEDNRASAYEHRTGDDS